MLRRVQGLLRSCQLHHLAYGLALLMGSILLFLTADTIHPVCTATCPPTVIFADVLDILGALLLMASLAFCGIWIGGVAQHTWQDRVHLDALTHQAEGELAELGRGQHPANPLLAHARAYFWGGTVAGLPALLLLLASLTDETLVPFILLFTVIAAAAAVVRGILLLRDGRSLLARVRAQAGLPVGSAEA